MTAPPRPTLAYRPELDGVRAIAVLAVLGYHVSFTAPGLVHFFRGGFLGGLGARIPASRTAPVGVVTVNRSFAYGALAAVLIGIGVALEILL